MLLHTKASNSSPGCFSLKRIGYFVHQAEAYSGHCSKCICHPSCKLPTQFISHNHSLREAALRCPPAAPVPAPAPA